jgi:hypothetical protein
VHRLLFEQREHSGSHVTAPGAMAGFEAASAEVPVVAAATSTVSVGVTLGVVFPVSLVATLAVFCVVVHQGGSP